VIPTQADASFVAAMEDALDVYQRPHDPARPVVYLDQPSRQLQKETRVAANDRRIEIGDDSLVVRRLPTLATILRHLWEEAQLLNDDVLITLVAGTHRRIGLHDNGCANLQLMELAAAPA
jgi:hypothetical protein